MKGVYHEGELTVQRRAGVRAMSKRVAGGIHNAIPPVVAEFLREQPMAIFSSSAPTGQVWASVLTGRPGFLHALDDVTVRIDAEPHPADPLTANLGLSTGEALERHELGMLVIDLATRRRMRINGAAEAAADGAILIHAQEVYANCPKYIQARELSAVSEGQIAPSAVRRGTALDARQQAWIAGADTFFLASAAPSGRADASHRGGNPGFVHVVDPATLEFPDYSGNTMFNSLGNITANPNAGLLFLDFETGDTLQLSGKAQVIWDQERAAGFPGAERIVAFHIEQVLQIAQVSPLRFRFLQSSRFNPS